jgi:hypothetical protein
MSRVVPLSSSTENEGVFVLEIHVIACDEDFGATGVRAYIEPKILHPNGVSGAPVDHLPRSCSLTGNRRRTVHHRQPRYKKVWRNQGKEYRYSMNRETNLLFDRKQSR